MKAMVLALVSGGLLLSIAPVVMAADISWQVRNAGGKQAAVELALVNMPAGENPFDPNYADVVATIVDPSGKTFSIPLFWYQGYEIVSSYNQLSNRKVGEPEWRLKFRPNIKGEFKISVSAKINGQQIAIPNTSYTVTETSPQQITIKGRNFVRGEEIFIPIAYNIAWASRYEEIAKYERWFKAASANGVNVARVWMASWSLGIEWNDTGLGDYTKRLDRAWALDQVFRIGAKYGIGIDLVLINHGAFSESTNPEWFANPYNSLNGGPVSNPGQFATDPTARKFWEQRLRYITARWAAEPALFTWEWWNEVNFTPISGQVLTDWIRWSDSLLKRWDPYKTITTTSWSSGASLQDWSVVDYAVTHVYDDKDPIKTLGAQASSLRAAVPDKPILVGEMGSGTVTEDPFTDPFGLHLHNAHWAATFVGFGAPASYWWWDIYVDPLNLWGLTKGLSLLLAGTNPVEMTPSQISTLKSTSTLLLSDNQHVLGWIRHNDYDRSAKARLLLEAAIKSLKTKKPPQTKFPDPKSKGGKVSIPVVEDGSYQVLVSETKSGKQLKSYSIVSKDKKLSFAIPAFTGDIAFKAIRKVG
ncbi:MAG: hypothetical protein RLZZ291_654 [Actinomycetota bacterium]|jgi:hypothetical protein